LAAAFVHLSGSFSGPDLQGSFTPLDISEEQWMGVYLNGEKIGYLSRKISPAMDGYTMDEAFRVKMIVMGKEKDVETLLKAELDKNLKLLHLTGSRLILISNFRIWERTCPTIIHQA
jgi:hypothetical protein